MPSRDTQGSALESALRSDRILIMTGLGLVVLAAATYTILGIGMDLSALTMTRMAVAMPGMAMKQANWSLSYGLVVFFMWWVMMIAMMVPSAAPMVLIHAATGRKQQVPKPLAATMLFLAGYLAIWAAYALLATLLQWALQSVYVVTGMMGIANPALAGLVAMAAGLYQLTPMKAVCLGHCRNPLTVVMHHWQPGRAGAFRMGLEHGSYCLGCCWFLMGLLFIGGIMNLIWILAIAIYVAFEKLSAGRYQLARATGLLLIVGGLYMVVKSLPA
jgi:predicted metal-binding membrane protein